MAFLRKENNAAKFVQSRGYKEIFTYSNEVEIVAEIISSLNVDNHTKQISSQLPALWLGILLLCPFTPVATSTKYDLPLPVLPAQCPDNFILLPNSNHCYGFQVGAPKDNVQTWKEADSSCKRDGGTLCHVPLEPSDATIFVFLRQKATQMKVESAWVARPPMIAQMSGRGNVSMTGNDHICTYVDFPVGSPQMYLNTEGCNQEKRSFICDIKITPMPVRLKRPTGHSRHRNDQDNFNRYERRKGYDSIRRRHQLDAQAAASEKEGPPRAVNKQDTGLLKEHVKPPSSKQVNQIMPPNLSGLAKLDPVRPTELLKARDNLLILMYGSPAVSPEMLEQGFLPGELDTANISKTSLETAKLLLLEIASEGMKPRQKRNATETAKALTITLLEEGRPLQCYYG
ncbi:hypothetical protein BV898_05064 [Hypsibius exemplaris]|uniref:C-type lectin domain-containing protein n=1 Tax=Hypsibius exemplaris TaxID=2072580 RepID=A0A1W0X0L7_HYPEX|nr:hypothetical protein BV898_05064 [Hypsibius exemplaris]